MSTMILSRIMPTIHKFNKDPKTKEHNSDFHWNVVLGNVSQKSSTQGEIFSSHSALKNQPDPKILFYQKMEVNFVNQTSKPKKCECIIFCQKIIYQPVTFTKLIENCKENKFYVFSFLMFSLMCIIFCSGNRFCRQFDLYKENQFMRDQLEMSPIH